MHNKNLASLRQLRFFKPLILFAVFLAAVLAVATPIGLTTSLRETENPQIPTTARPEAELARIVAPDGTLTAQFGEAMDIDGDTLVIGAPFSRNASNNEQGAVYIFVRNGANWEFQAKLNPPAGSSMNSRFGISVGISGDTIVAGASNNEVGSIAGKGSAWVFTRNGVTWSLQQQLTGAETVIGSQLGFSVSISGNTIVAGAPEDSVDTIRRGTAYVFVRNGTVWSQESRLIDTNGNTSDRFGYSLDIYGDTIGVGAIFADTGATGIFGGMTCVFVRNASIWTRQARLAASDAAGSARFGSSIAIEADTMVVGATDSINGPSASGAAYVFARNSGVWTESQRLVPTSLTGLAEFGFSVGISGNRIIIGDTNATVNFNSQGAAFLFIKNGAAWTQQNRLTASDAAIADRFGASVAISGSRFFVGADQVNMGELNNVGAVYYFNEAPGPPNLHDASDTGVSNSDNITKSQALSFDVSGITPGATIELLREGSVVDSEIVGGSTATLTDTAPPNGTFRYTSRQVIGGEASAPSEPLNVTVDTTVPSVFLNQGASQQDPTINAFITFRAVFSEIVTPLEQNDISLAGSTANISNATIVVNNLSTVQSDVVVTDVISNGQVVAASIPAGAVTDIAGNVSIASAGLDNTVTLDNVRPTVTIEQGAGQADPTTTLPVNYIVTFSEPVVPFGDVFATNLNGSVVDADCTVTGGPTVYNVAVSNFNSNGGTLRIVLNDGAVPDLLGNRSMPSTSIDNAVTIDNVRPTVTVNQILNQADPTSSQPISFRALFSENVTGFDPNDVQLGSSTANVSQAIVNITGVTARDYTISVRNVISSGQVRATVSANGAADALGNQNVASTSTDNSVTLQIPAFATITGRVANESGRGMGMVRIVATLPGGETRYLQTSPFGYYKIVNAPTVEVTLTFTRKNRQPVTQTFFLVQYLAGNDVTITFFPPGDLVPGTENQ